MTKDFSKVDIINTNVVYRWVSRHPISKFIMAMDRERNRTNLGCKYCSIANSLELYRMTENSLELYRMTEINTRNGVSLVMEKSKKIHRI